MSTTASASSRPRVLQCITRLGLGGAERVAFSLIHALQRDVEFGMFTVYQDIQDAVGESMRQELAVADVPWFPGTRLPVKRGGMLTGGIALARAIRRFRPDVVHFHSETPEACGAVARLLLGRRQPGLVRTIHNSVFWRYWPRIGRWCDRRLAAAEIACVSEAARDEFLRYRRDSGARAPLAPPAVIYNSVDLAPRPPHETPHEARKRCVLFAGRFEHQKGVDLLCDALRQTRLPADCAGELVCIGQGSEESRLRALAAAPPNGWTITVRPPAASLSAAFECADLAVIPSRFEGLALVSIEATLHGVPIVATQAPGLSETLPDGHPWLAAPANASELARTLDVALAETARWGDSVRAAQQLALTRFSVAAMRDGYAALYRRAGAKRNGTMDIAGAVRP